MRVIVRGCEALPSYLSSLRSLSHQSLQRLPLVTRPKRQSDRSFTSKGPLAAWNWRPTNIQHVTEPDSEPTKTEPTKTPSSNGVQTVSPAELKAMINDALKSELEAIVNRHKSSLNDAQPKERPNQPDKKLNQPEKQPDLMANILDALRTKPKANVAKQESVIGALPHHEPDAQSDLQKEFNAIMKTAQPDQVMAALLRSDFEHIVASMPQSAFVEAFLLLSPSHFIEPFKVIHKPIHPRGAYIKQYRPIQLVYDDFARNLSFIIRTRLTGSALGMAEYTHLLDCARSLGDATMADYVWHSMKQEHITPSLQCFNYYMDAKIWNMAYAGVQRHNMRINKYRYLKRTYQDAPGFEAYGTGPLSLRKVIRQLFNEMTEAGHDGNEASMINLMLASARVGDEPGVKNVLKTIWNVDVDALHAGIYDPVTEYDRSSPFYPTSHLLFAIANAFGTNNDIHSALSIVEHITNCYDIYISEAAWDELFTWSWVLSRHKDPGMEVEHDRVPCELSESLFEMITTEHNVEPTVEMHRKMAKTAFGKTDLTTYVHHMREAYKLLEKTREKGKAARKMVESYLEQLQHLDPGSQAATQILRSSGFAEAIHTYDILRHGAMQQTHIIEHLAKMMFTRISWTWYSAEWESILLPQLAEEWRDFIPDRISYSTMTGNRVYFKGRTCWETFNMLPQDALQIRRPSLADDFIVGQSSLEVKDDIIWAVWARRLSRHDLRSPLLMRIFEPWRSEHATEYAIPKRAPDGQTLTEETEDEETPMENFYAELNQENTEPSEENTEPIEEDGSFFWQRPLIQYDLDGAIEFSHQRKEDVFEWGFGSIEFVPVSQTTRQDPLEPGRQDPLEFNDQDPLELDSQDPLQLGSQ